METIPNGIEKLVLLKKFNWTKKYSSQELFNPLPNPFSNFIPNLVHLQWLNFADKGFLDVGVKQLIGLRKLEIFFVSFSSLHNFNSYMRTQHYRRLTHYRIQLNEPKVPDMHFCKSVTVSAYKLKEGGKENNDYQLVLPTNLQALQIMECHLPVSLLDVSPSLKIAKDLKMCCILECKGIEYLWWVEDWIASLNTLFLKEMPSLRVLFMLRPTDIVSCSNLKHLLVSDCHNLKHLFAPELAKYHLQNLQTIYVKTCRQMEDIIVTAAEVEEDSNEMNNLILCFPNLQSLYLRNLPELKSIWKGRMTCDSLKGLCIWECPKLRRLPLSVHITDGDGERRASTPPLKQIEVEKEWWDGVEWDTHPHAKSVFQPLLVPIEDSKVLFEMWDSWNQDMNDIIEEV